PHFLRRMPNKLLGQFRRMSDYALERPKLHASCRMEHIFLGMICCGLTKEFGKSVVYVATFLTVDGFGPSTTLDKKGAFRLFRV
ncbi:MAG: hypothetical protein WB614_05005, partial [Pseudolabrys sp.]